MFLCYGITQNIFAQWTVTGTVAATYVAANGSNLYVGQNYYGSNPGTSLYFSSNNGNGFVSAMGNGYVPSPSQSQTGTYGPLSNIVFKGTDVFAGVGYVVLQSSNNGASWSNTSSGLPGGGYLAVSGNDIYLASNGIYKSTNNGILWTALNTTITSINAIAANGNTIIVGTTNNGIYLSTNGGLTWNTVNTGLSGQVYAVAILGTTFLAGTSSGLYRTTNNGTNWTITNMSNAVSCFATAGNNIFAGTTTDGSTNGSGVFLSTDNGLTWTGINNGLTPLNISSLAANNTYVFATAQQAIGIQYAGSLWRRPLSEIMPSYVINIFENPTNGGVTTGSGSYLSGSSATLTATANNGYTFSNWTENGNVVSSNNTYIFTVSANRNLVAQFTPITFTVTTSSNPTNAGTTLLGGSYISGSSATVIAIANNGYIFSNWTENGNIVSSNNIYAFTVSANRNLIAQFSSITGIKENPFANSFNIYPNPAGEILNVELDNMNEKQIKILVYDVLGKVMTDEALKLKNGKAQINVSELESGIYFIKAENEVKKFVKE